MASGRFIVENARATVRKHPLSVTLFHCGHVFVAILFLISPPELTPRLCWTFGIHQIASNQEDLLFLLKSYSKPFEFPITRTKHGERFKRLQKVMILRSMNLYCGLNRAIGNRVQSQKTRQKTVIADWRKPSSFSDICECCLVRIAIGIGLMVLVCDGVVPGGN